MLATPRDEHEAREADERPDERPDRPAPARRRTRLSVEERRARLLEIGIGIFSRRSFDSVSIDDIAEEAEVSKGLLYHYFGSKRGYYVETIRELAGRIEAITEPDPDLPAPVALERAILAFIEFIEEKARFYIAFMRGGIGSDPEVAVIVESVRRVEVERILALLGLPDRQAPPTLRVAVHGAIGFIEAATLRWLEEPRLMEREQLLSLMLRVVEAISPAALLGNPEDLIDVTTDEPEDEEDER